MEKIGAFEAKTHLSQLLERVAKGERFTIEKHGVPVASLEPVRTSKRESAVKVIAALKQFRVGHRIGNQSIREMIEEGRR